MEHFNKVLDQFQDLCHDKGLSKTTIAGPVTVVNLGAIRELNLLQGLMHFFFVK